MSDFFVENFWTCTSCQAKNLGRELTCTQCGAAKTADALEELGTPESTEVTDPKLLLMAQQGPNWVCEFCGGQARDEQGKCTHCAGPKPLPLPPPVDPTEPPMTTVRVLPTVPESYAETLRAKTQNDFLAQRRILKQEQEQAEAGSKLTPWVPISVVALVLLGAGAAATWTLKPRDRTVRVDNMAWIYTAELQERHTVHTEGWGSRADAFNVSCVSKYYGEEDCHPHSCNPHRIAYDCNCSTYQCNCRQECVDQKNGFSKCSQNCSSCTRCASCYRMEYDTCYDQCPVNRQWCAYDYFEWLTLKVQKTAGSGQETYWADVPVRLEDQRLVKHEEYSVYFVDGTDRWSYAPKTLEEYQYFYSSAIWKVRVNRAGGIWPQLEVKE